MIRLRTLPAGVALQREIAAAFGWQPWELDIQQE